MPFVILGLDPYFSIALLEGTAGHLELAVIITGDKFGILRSQGHGRQPKMIQWPYHGPDSAPMEVCLKLKDGDRDTARAITCHAWGDEMPSRCTTCEDDHSRCFTLRNTFRNACSNCILTGRESSCEWLTHDDLDSDEEYDYIPTERAAVRVTTESLASGPETRAKRAGNGGSESTRARKKQCIITSRRDSETQARRAKLRQGNLFITAKWIAANPNRLSLFGSAPLAKRYREILGKA